MASPKFRQVCTGPLLDSLRAWLRETLGRVSKKSELAKAIGYVLTRWPALTRYRDDGRIEIDIAAERSLRTVALGRKNYLFCGSDAGGERIAEHPIKRVEDLLPWAVAGSLQPDPEQKLAA